MSVKNMYFLGTTKYVIKQKIAVTLAAIRIGVLMINDLLTVTVSE